MLAQSTLCDYTIHGAQIKATFLSSSAQRVCRTL
jgi:hypothetical protein